MTIDASYSQIQIKYYPLLHDEQTAKTAKLTCTTTSSCEPEVRKRVRSQNSLGNRLVRRFAIRRRFRAPPASRVPPSHRGRLVAELTLLATAFFPFTLRFEASPRPLLAMRHVGLLNSRAFGLTRRLTSAIAVSPLTLESPLENAPPLLLYD